MTDRERRRRVEEVCDAALDCDAGGRAAFVAAACGGDHALQQEVEVLLAHAQTAEGFLVTPIGEVAAHVLDDAHQAALVAGTRIASYEITSRIGVGGMGEVYSAIDTALGRQVAIKVISDPFTHDPARLARFEREAKLLASLNHPNVAQVHGLERSGAFHALVMELVEGEDLSQRIARGPIPLDEALPIARQIAEGLEAAHEQGIIHRDLKPANVKVRADGTVKVLDFGLAQAITTQGASGPPGNNNSAVPTRDATQFGTVVGTAAYMSPEQAKGGPVDRRSDIWAFGAVLYEMLTSQRAFKGDTVSRTLAAVIRATPDYHALPAATPPRLRRLLQRCLERDVRIRLRDIGEARVELVALESGGTSDQETATSWYALKPARAAWIAAGVLAGAALTAFGLLAFAGSSPPPREVARASFQLTLPIGAELTTSGGGAIGISPNGRYIVFAANSEGKRALWLRPIHAVDAKMLPGTEGGILPFWSPDSAFIAFFADSQLKKIEISTGVLQLLCEASPFPGGGAWSRDGVILFAPMLESQLFRVPASGGVATPVTTLDTANRESNHNWPAFLPDGRHYVFQAFGLSQAGIYLGTLDSPERTLLIHQESLDATAVQYAPSGHLVFVRDHSLVAQPFDARSLKLSGDAFPLAVGFGIGGPGTPAFGVSDNGVLVFRQTGEPATFQPTWFGRDGMSQGTVGPPGAYRSFDLSPDGQTLALDRYTERDVSIWLVDVRRGTSTRFTSDAFSAAPQWSPAGDQLEFGSVRDTPPNPFVRTLSGAERRLARLPANVDITSWAPDGRLLIGEITNVNTQADLWLFSASGDSSPRPFIRTAFDERDAEISPDGRWVAFTSDEGGTPEIYVTTFPEAGRRVRVSTHEGDAARWRDDGRELFFQTRDKLMAVTIATNSRDTSTDTIGLETSLPRELFALPAATRFWIPARGGQRFLVSVLVTKAVPAPITVVLNWNAPTDRQ